MEVKQLREEERAAMGWPQHDAEDQTEQRSTRRGGQATVEEVAISDISCLEKTVWARKDYNEAALADYRDHCDALPPVIIRRVRVTEDTYQFWPAPIRTDVDTVLPRDEQGAVPWPVDLLVLSNGFYTVRACQLEGRTHVRALIIDGTLQQAMEDAIVRNAKNSVRFTKSEMQNAVLRMKEMYPQLSARKLADKIGCSHTTVEDMLKIHDVQTALKQVGKYLPSRSHERAMAFAPKERWEDLADLVKDDRLTAAELELKAKQAAAPPAAPEPELAAAQEPQEEPGVPQAAEEGQEAPAGGAAACGVDIVPLEEAEAADEGQEASLAQVQARAEEDATAQAAREQAEEALALYGQLRATIGDLRARVAMVAQAALDKDGLAGAYQLLVQGIAVLQDLRTALEQAHQRRTGITAAPQSPGDDHEAYIVQEYARAEKARQRREQRESAGA